MRFFFFFFPFPPPLFLLLVRVEVLGGCCCECAPVTNDRIVLILQGRLFGWGRADMGELTSVVGRETRTVCRPTHIPLPDGARCAALAPGSLHVLAALDDGTTYVLSWAAVVLFWVVGCRCRFVDTVALYVRYLSKKKNPASIYLPGLCGAGPSTARPARDRRRTSGRPHHCGLTPPMVCLIASSRPTTL